MILLDPSLARRLYQVAKLDAARVAARSSDPELYELIRQIFAFGYEDATEGRNSPQPAASSKEELLTTRAAAERLGMTTTAGVTKAIREGRLPAERVEGRWAIRRQDVDDYRATPPHPSKDRR